MIWQYSQPPPAYGASVSVLIPAGGYVNATFNNLDASGQYGWVTFTSGPYNGQTLLFPFRSASSLGSVGNLA
jgi:hypothetical protein